MYSSRTCRPHTGPQSGHGLALGITLSMQNTSSSIVLFTAGWLRDASGGFFATQAFLATIAMAAACFGFAVLAGCATPRHSSAGAAVMAVAMTERT